MPIDPNILDSYQDAVVTVMGLGRYKQGSGIGAAKWLMRHGAQLVITDLKDEQELHESIQEITSWYERYKEQFPDRDIYQPVFVLGEHHEEDFTDVDLVMQNPGVPRESIFVRLAKEHGVQVESDISLFFRLYPHSIYAVTGTRGKSTVTALTGEMLKTLHPKAVVAGNIAISPLEFLDDLLKEEKPVPVILELSSWLIESLESVKRGPDIAVLTNIYEDHLNRYGSMDAYMASKALMFEYQTSTQKAVVSLDHERVRSIAERTPSLNYWYSRKQEPKGNGAFVREGMMMVRLDGQEHAILSIEEMRLRGNHNVENALAATMVAMLAGVPLEGIQHALKTFGGLPGRQEELGDINGIYYVNDTTATSPDGLLAALDRFGPNGDIILLAGGASKELSFETVAQTIPDLCKFVVLFDGEGSDLLEKALNHSIPLQRVYSMKEAVDVALLHAKKGDIILLSPGTASFGLFKNEYDRGDQFVAEVNKRKGVNSVCSKNS